MPVHPVVAQAARHEAHRKDTNLDADYQTMFARRHGDRCQFIRWLRKQLGTKLIKKIQIWTRIIKRCLRAVTDGHAEYSRDVKCDGRGVKKILSRLLTASSMRRSAAARAAFSPGPSQTLGFYRPSTKTSIGVGLVTAILQSQVHDDAKAATLLQIEHDGVMHKRWNGIGNCEKLSAQRKASLARQKQFEGEIKSLQEQMKIDKHRSDLKEQVAMLRKEIDEEKAGRREWTLRKAEIDSQLAKLREGALADVQINAQTVTSQSSIGIDKQVTDRSLNFQDLPHSPLDIPRFLNFGLNSFNPTGEFLNFLDDLEFLRHLEMDTAGSYSVADLPPLPMPVSSSPIAESSSRIPADQEMQLSRKKGARS
ncbi:hypothetical protein B0H10DRAFT_1963226 [Mycena sp. CBHHK59/15]|nr:hypothetical protein B0H10DRAFT_1963226 [Mycena sp. CBHHK59/15]